MKTETQIAEDWINKWEKDNRDFPLRALTQKFACISHKASCQRFLEFLESECRACTECGTIPYGDGNCHCGMNEWDSIIENKITDLKQAIKLYDEAGI